VLERAGRWREAALELGAAAAEGERSGAGDDGVALAAERAELLCRAGRPVEGLAVLDRALDGHPRAPALLLGRAAAHRAAGHTDTAEGDLRALLTLSPDGEASATGAAWLALALAARDLRAGDLDEAEALARRAVRRAPRSAVAHEALGAVLGRRGDQAGAVAALERAAAQGEPDAEVLDRLGDAYLSQGRGAEAAAAWRRALTAAADAPPAVGGKLAPALRRKLRGLRAGR
jgi:predicted Zn-dependent protease